MAEEEQRYVSVDVETANSLVRKGYVLLDVRTPQEFASSHALGAINIPFMLQTDEGRKHNPDFMTTVLQLFPVSADLKMVVTCGGGSRGTSAATTIAEAGYSSVLCMPGGMKAWVARGLPIT